MKLFVFGAGASRGSQDGMIRVETPAPLVDNLFDEQYLGARDFQWGEPPDNLAAWRRETEEAGSLEKWLTERWESINSLRNPRTRGMRRAEFGWLTFHLWSLFQRVSLGYSRSNGYHAFAQLVLDQDQDFGLISFNYDTLLDRALVDNGFQLSSLQDYLDAPYLKPHGSVNWILRRRDTDRNVGLEEVEFDDIVRLRTAASSMYGDQPLDVGRMEVLDPGHQDLKKAMVFCSPRFDRQYSYPFVLVPLTAKVYSQFRLLEEKIVRAARQLATQATELTVIGYRARDEIIRDILAGVARRIPVHVVAREDAIEIQGELMAACPKLEAGHISSAGFRAWIDRGLAFD